MTGSALEFSVALAKLAGPKNATLYVRRPLLNAQAVIDWAKSQGFDTCQLPEDMHVTQAYSKTPVDWPESDSESMTVNTIDNRAILAFGDGACAVLAFQSLGMQQRFEQLCELGCSYDYPEYTPHVTLSWQVPDDLDLESIEPYTGPLEFGPEIFAEIDDDWQENHVEKTKSFIHFGEALLLATKPEVEKRGARHTVGEYKKIQEVHDHAVSLGAMCSNANVESDAPNVGKTDFAVMKADDKLGLVFGWAIVSKNNNSDYYDSQGDHIPEDSMLKAAADFMSSKRDMKIMHKGKAQGTVLFAFPLTSDIAKSMGITTNKTGLMIAVKPDSQDTLDKFVSGEYTGFSIGGDRGEDEEVD